MARNNNTVTVDEFPILTPQQYIWLATGIGGLSRQDAQIKSGYNRGTWYNWYDLYPREGKLPKDRGAMERLYRIAETNGWINEGAIAA